MTQVRTIGESREEGQPQNGRGLQMLSIQEFAVIDDVFRVDNRSRRIQHYNYGLRAISTFSLFGAA